jgi:hypothetical protein
VSARSGQGGADRPPRCYARPILRPGGDSLLRGVWAYILRHQLALFALFVALGGSAYAAAMIGPRDIQSDAIHKRHIDERSVVPGDLRRPSVVLTAGKMVDYDSISPHACIEDRQVVGGQARRGDVTVVVDTDEPANLPAGLVVTAKAVRYEPLPPPPDNAQVAVSPWTVCNITGDPINPPETFMSIVVLRGDSCARQGGPPCATPSRGSE